MGTAAILLDVYVQIHVKKKESRFTGFHAGYFFFFFVYLEVTPPKVKPRLKFTAQAYEMEQRVHIAMR